MMTLHQQWTENRRRRKLGFLEVDRNGQEIAKRRSCINWPCVLFDGHDGPCSTDIALRREEAAKLAEETRASYDPASPKYRRYQGD